MRVGGGLFEGHEGRVVRAMVANGRPLVPVGQHDEEGQQKVDLAGMA